MFCAKGIETQNQAVDADEATRYGKGFALSGGVTNAVTRVLSEKGDKTDITVQPCNGADECRKALLMLKAGKLPVDFVEGMFCQGGCMGGPGTLTELQRSKKVFSSHLDGSDQVLQTGKTKADGIDLQSRI